MRVIAMPKAAEGANKLDQFSVGGLRASPNVTVSYSESEQPNFLRLISRFSIGTGLRSSNGFCPFTKASHRIVQDWPAVPKRSCAHTIFSCLARPSFTSSSSKNTDKQHPITKGKAPKKSASSLCDAA